jgi:penicillin-binding protein 2
MFGPDDSEKQALSFSRRALFIGGVQLAGLGILGGRLAWLQIAQGRKYKKLAESNRINAKLLPPSRGKILDRRGTPLAINRQNFRILVIPEQTGDLQKALHKIAKLVQLEPSQIEKTIQTAKKLSHFAQIEVKDDLSWNDVSKIEVHLPDLPGVFVDEGEMRSYPQGEISGHITGYVGLPTKEDLSTNPIYALPGFRLGKTGIEKGMDQALTGKVGQAQVEVNVMGREVRELARQKSIVGQTLSLSIDSQLQRAVHDRLSAETSASAVIMDARTGAIYALSSYPSYDPNKFIYGLSTDDWEGLLADPGHPLTNKAVSGIYPPASTFKMITILAGLESGHITPSTRVYCPGHFKYNKDKFHCWKLSGHGSVGLKEALAYSCDVFFYELSLEIGINKIAAVARKMGLGQKYGLSIPGEKQGLIPDQKWKLGAQGKDWTPGETIIASIGQGYLQATPLQLAVMLSRFVNGGYGVKPWLLAQTGRRLPASKSWPKLNVKDKHLKLIRQGMVNVVNTKKGTAFGARIVDPMMAMAGKTGTAQVKKINRKQRLLGIQNEDLPWKDRHHALFVGYAPIDKPRYVCSVIVEHGVGGAQTAAPIARDILLAAQQIRPASQ